MDFAMGGVVFWVVLAAALIIIELFTTQFVCIWFAVGALFAAFTSFAGAPLLIQLVIFLVVSVATVWVGRPLLMEKMAPSQMKTNTELMIGQTGVVLEEINNAKEAGRVEVSGLYWTARSEDGSVLAAGARILTTRLDGVKLIVKPLAEQENTPGQPTAPDNESEV